MNRFLLKLSSTHVAAVLLGLGIAAVMEPHRTRIPDAVRPQGDTRSAAAVSRDESQLELSVGDLRQTWQQLATTPMTAIERAMLKQRLIQEWTARDPLDLLQFLDSKHAWPQACTTFDASLFKSALPRVAPAALFDFSRRNGYNAALFDPRGANADVWRPLVLALHADDRGEAWNKSLSEHADDGWSELAMRFYRDGRLAEFHSEAAKLRDDKGRKDLAEQIAGSMQLEKIDARFATRLLDLPEDLREDVAEDVFWELRATGMSSREARDERRRLAAALAEASLPKAADAAVSSMAVDNWCPPFDKKQGMRENAEWVSTLPETPPFDCVRKAVFERWTEEDPEAAFAFVPTLEAGRIRDLVAATVVGRARCYNADSSEERQTKLHRLIDLIEDPKVREQFDEGERNQFPEDPFSTP